MKRKLLLPFIVFLLFGAGGVDLYAGNGLPGTPYTIGTGGDYSDLDILSTQTGYYKLLNDLTIPSSWPAAGKNVIAGVHFDGDDWTITLPSSTALFQNVGAVSPVSSIKNINLKGQFTIAGGPLVSALATNTSFENCRVDPSSTAITVAGTSSEAGGLIAATSGGSVTNCYAHSNVGGASTVYAGGLIGAATNTTITGCFATGPVTASAGTTADAGGLVGVMVGGSITQSYALGNVITTTMPGYSGGLVGSNMGTISESYAAGTVTASTSGINGGFAGGVVGYNTGTLTNAHYALNAVTGAAGRTNLIANNIGTGSASGCNSNAGTTLSNYAGFTPIWDTFGNTTYPFLTASLIDPKVKHSYTVGDACSRTLYTIPSLGTTVTGSMSYRYRSGMTVSYYYKAEQYGNSNRFNDTDGRLGIPVTNQYTAERVTTSSAYDVVPYTDFSTNSSIRIWVYPRVNGTIQFDPNYSYHFDLATIHPLPQATWKGYVDPYSSKNWTINGTPSLQSNTICYDYRDTTMTNLAGIYTGLFATQYTPRLEPRTVDTAYVRIDFTGTAPYTFSYEKEMSNNGNGFMGNSSGTRGGSNTHYISTHHGLTSTPADGKVRWNGNVGLFSIMPDHVDDPTTPRGGTQPAYTGFNLEFSTVLSDPPASPKRSKAGYFVEDAWGCLSNSFYVRYNEAIFPHIDPDAGIAAYDTVIVNPLPIMQYPYPEYQDANRSFAHMDTVVCEGDTVWKKVFYNPVISTAFADSMHFQWTWTANTQNPVFGRNAFDLPANTVPPFNAATSIYMPEMWTKSIQYNSSGPVSETDSLKHYWNFTNTLWPQTNEYVINHIKDPRTYTNLFPAGYNPTTDAGVTTFNVDMPDLHGIELNDYANFAAVGPMNAARCNSLDSVPTFKVPVEWRGSVTKANIRITPFFVNIKGGVCYAKETDYGYDDYQYWRYRGVTDYSITVNPRPFPLIENQYQLSVANGSSTKPIYLDNQIVDFDTVPSPRHRLLPGMNYQPAIDTSWYAWTNVSPQMGLVTVYDSVSGSAVPPTDPSYPLGGSLYSAYPRARDYIPAFEVYNYSLSPVYDTIRIRPYFINRIVCHGRDTIAVIKILPKQKPAILESPQSAIICLGSNHVLSVTATGDNLSFEWFKGGVKMNGRYDDTLQINNASFYDYDDYYVKVTGLNDSIVISDPAHIWVADPLPNDLKFTTELTTVEPNKSYPLTVAYYDLDVPVYTWTYSNNSAAFAYLETSTHDNLFKTGAKPESGTISVEMTHVCGNRTLTQNVTARGGTGIDEVGGEFRIYPNPVSSILYIQPKNGERNEASDAVVVTDANGRVIKSTLLAPINYQLSTSGWTSGVYFIQVKTNAGTEVHKIVKN